MEIRFGCMAPPLSRQLRKYAIDKEKVKEFQRDSDAISRLYIRGVICETVKGRTYRMLYRKICAEIRNHNE